MPKNYLLIYSEQLATDIELLCQSIKAPSNTSFQIRKSSTSVYANIREANYGQSRADMLSKFEIALKECSETEGWLQLLSNTNAIDDDTYKKMYENVERGVARSVPNTLPHFSRYRYPYQLPQFLLLLEHKKKKEAI